MKKVLLLGSKGFLGSKVQDILKAAPGLTLLCHNRSVFSLTDIEALSTFLRNESPDAIINCAVRADFATNEIVGDFYTINTLLPAILAGWCKDHYRYYLHISGTIVHGIRASYVNINSPYHPDCLYGQSKYLAELNILFSGVRHAIIRFGGIWGKNGPSHLGINKALHEAMSGRRLTLFGIGGRRNYIHVQCAAKVVVWILQQELTGIFYGAAPKVTSIEEMVSLLTQKFNYHDKPPAKLGDYGSYTVTGI